MTFIRLPFLLIFFCSSENLNSGYFFGVNTKVALSSFNLVNILICWTLFHFLWLKYFFLHFNSQQEYRSTFMWFLDFNFYQGHRISSNFILALILNFWGLVVLLRGTAFDCSSRGPQFKSGCPLSAHLALWILKVSGNTLVQWWLIIFDTSWFWDFPFVPGSYDF